MTSDQAVLQAFSELAPEYEAAMDRELTQYLGIGYREFVEGLVAWADVKPDDRVLDVATGTAVIPRQIAASSEAHRRIVGLDITPAMLQQGRAALAAEGRFASISLVGGSGLALPFAPGSFDLVLCAFGTHHMDVPQMLQQMGRVLQAGGRIVIAEAGAPAYWRTMRGRILLKILLWAFGLTKSKARGQIEEDAFRHLYTPEEWRTLLSDAGFGEVRIRPSRGRRSWYPRVLTMSARVNKH